MNFLSKSQKYFSILLILANLFLFFSFTKNSSAELAIIRDTEIEKFLHEVADQIFLQAGLNPGDIKIYIINDNSINAFVAGGQNLFVNTGLIRKFKTPDALIGVIAHEAGHIAGGHLVRSMERGESLQQKMILGYILGIAAIAGGSPEAGSAMILGSSQIAERSYLKFSRAQEESADTLAIEYLGKIKYPADGLINLLEIFDAQTIGYKDKIDEYQITHPVSRKRIDLIKAKTANLKFSDFAINQKLQSKMDRVLLKLEGFLDDPQKVLEKYQNQNGQNQNYVQSIANYRKGNFSSALEQINSVILKNPKDGFLYELKGDFLYSQGSMRDSIIAYNKAIKNLSAKDSAIAKINLANGILAITDSDQELIEVAIERLNEAKKFEEDNSLLFKNLARAYLAINEEGKSKLALAEFNFLANETEKCRKFAKEALELLKESDKSERIRAQDLIEISKNIDKENKN